MRFSIRTKLLVGLSAMVFLTGVIALLAINRLSKIAETSLSLVEEAIPEVHVLSEMTHLISTMDRDLERLLLNRRQQEYRVPIENKEKSVRELLTTYKRFHPAPPQEIEKALRELTSRCTALQNATAEIITFAKQEQNQRGRALLSGNWKELQRATLDSLNDLMNFEDDETKRDAELIQNESRSGRIQMINLAGVAILLGIALALWISSSVAKPIRSLVKVMERVSEGDLASRAEIKTADEIGRLARQFNAMIDELNKSFEDQRRFYNDASHELRTPLTIIRGVAEVTLRGPEKSRSEYVEALRSIVELTIQMGRLVDDLLYLARSEAGQPQYEMVEVPLADLINEVVDQSRSLTSPKDLCVKLDVEMSERILIRGDAKRLRQLFLILIDNAIKYTKPGGRITLALKPELDWAKVLVCDTGVGISEKDIPHVFERFYRGDMGGARSEASTGIGLSIAQSIVKAHKGKILVESVADQGTTFAVFLPRSHRMDDGVA